jgi:tetraacyldisaccharide 4'-kinase
VKWLKKLISQFYSTGTAFHRFLYNKGLFVVHQFPTPVLSIGNLTVGGSGKTPLTLFLASELKKSGVTCAVVCKSYKAGLEESQELPTRPDPTLYGDEACLVKQTFPSMKVISGPKKWESAKLAVFDRKIQAILLDDGFQHHALFQNWKALVFDLSQEMDNVIWRDSFDQIKNADAVFLSRSSEENRKKFTQSLQAQNVIKPVFEIRLESLKLRNSMNLQEVHIDGLGLALAGIAQPKQFFENLCQQYPSADFDTKSYSDHHRYSAEEIKKIELEALKKDWKYIVCTEKDWVKISQYTKLTIWNTAHMEISIQPKIEWTIYFKKLLGEIGK